MAEVQIAGCRENLIGLLRCWADELEAGEWMSSTGFAQQPGDDPSHTLRLVVDDIQRMDTMLKVFR